MNDSFMNKDRTLRNSPFQRHLLVRPAAPVLGALLILSSLIGCGEPETEVEEVIRPVRYLVAEPASASRARIYSGTSKSALESRLSFKVSGTVEALPIYIGDQLKKGQLIAQLDASLLELQAQQSEANLIQAQASLRNAEAGYQRVRGLYAGNNASRDDLDTARAAAESAEAQVKAAEKQLELAQLNVSYSRLYAKTDCTVASIDVEVNENVSPGNPIATVTCGSALEVELAVPESLIGELSNGIPATVRFDAVRDQTFSGTVSEVGVAVGSGATFPVTVAIDGAHPDLRSGLAAEVRFDLATGEQGELYLVPLSAVVEDGGEKFVYLAMPEGDGDLATIERRSVQIGELTDLGLEVLEGLSPGDRVVTAGTSVIREGLKVKLGEPDSSTAGQP